jgi:phage/plasmid-like protein (TIGR03299 family)
MAHALTNTAGKIEMAYVGEMPWHGLGQKLDQTAGIPEWLKAAGMEWRIRKVPLRYYADRAQTDLRTDDEMSVLIRNDTGARLGVVSSDYQIVQPADVIEYFQDLVEYSGFKLHTAGTLFGGKKFWALAQIDEASVPNFGWDKIGGFYLLSSSADGSRATDGRETTVRVVCNNTLTAALEVEGKTIKHGFKLSHRQRFDADKVKKSMGMSRESFHATMETIGRLASVPMTFAAADDFVLRLLKPSEEAKLAIEQNAAADTFEALLARGSSFSPVEPESRRPRGADTILGLFSGEGKGATQKGSSGTAWGLVNAVTEYIDHYATAKSPDHLLERSLWGSGDELKTAAYNQALAYC